MILEQTVGNMTVFNCGIVLNIGEDCVIAAVGSDHLAGGELPEAGGCLTRKTIQKHYNASGFNNFPQSLVVPNSGLELGIMDNVFSQNKCCLRSEPTRCRIMSNTEQILTFSISTFTRKFPTPFSVCLVVFIRYSLHCVHHCILVLKPTLEFTPYLAR